MEKKNLFLISVTIWSLICGQWIINCLKSVDNDLKNAKKFLVKITTQKLSEKEALKLYSDLIILDIATLEKSNSKSKKMRKNISNVQKNLESVFTGVYFQRTKLRKQRLDEIAKKERMINPKMFREYLDMYKDLNKTTGLEENKAQVNTIKNRLANLMEAFKSSPTSDAKKN